MGEKINKCRVLVWRPEGRRPLGRTRQRWENNIKMYMKRMRWKFADWLQLAQNMGKITGCY
jgi:hypothetical protein